ncbi:mandelate racemase/muconate lactonizing enzyme family protein [Paracidovorax citrulli]
MSADTITSISCIPMRLPFHHWTQAPLFAGRPRDKLDSALVRIETRDGTIGWGESYCVEPAALKAIFNTLVSPLVCGKAGSDDTLLPQIQRTLHNLGRSGPVLHALAGLDIALWDLKAKRAGVPLYALLGGKQRDRVRAYASLLQYYADPELIRRNVERALEAGYREVKLHERTVIAVAAAREAMGPGLPLMIDTNCAWSPVEAREMIAGMAEHQPLWIEEPLWPPEDHRALAALANEASVPIAVGENASSAWELSQLIAGGAAHFAQPSVIKIGLTAALELSRQCEGSAVRCAPQVAFFGPGYLAALHLLAAQRTEAALERLFVELRHVPYGTTVPVIDGWATVPDTPGLGAEPELALMEGRFSE